MDAVLNRARRRPRASATLALVGIVLVSAVVRMILARGVPGPWIFVDELIYSELGRSAYGGFAIRDLRVSGYGIVYPLLIAPAYAVFSDLVTAYQAVKAINSLVMSLTAIPVYLLARTLMGRRWSLAAAALAVLIPSMAYTGVVMTESAFYPVFALAILLFVLALQRERWWWQVLAFAAAIACYETRPQGIVLVPAFVAAAVLAVVLAGVTAGPGERSGAARREIRRLLPTWVITVVGLIALEVAVLARGGWGELLGAYSVTAQYTDRYEPRAIIGWFLLHVGELQLWLGVLPFVALLVALGASLRRDPDPALRAFAATAVPVMLVMTAVVSAFVVFANVQRIEERNLFYIGILPLVALCWWASRRFERPQPRWFVVAIGLSLIGPVALPYDWLLTPSAVSDTFGVFLPYAFQSRLMDTTFTPFAVGIGMLVIVAALLWTPQRLAALVVAVVALFMVVTGAAVDRRTDKAAVAAQAGSEPRNWIDRAVGPSADVSVVFLGGADPMRVWQAEFFNRSVGTVNTLFAPLSGGLPDRVVSPQPDGALVTRDGEPVTSQYVLADSLTEVAGEAVAADAAFGMELVRTDGPVRVREVVVGVTGDGWSGADVTYTRYACDGGAVVLLANSNNDIHVEPVVVTPFVGETALPAVAVPGAPEPTPIRVPLTAADGTCQVRFNVGPLASPADTIGSSDTRQLGIIVEGLVYEPNG